MALKNIFSLFGGKKQDNQLTEQERKNDTVNALIEQGEFPIVRATDVDMSKYRKIPWSGIAALGTVFSQLPDSARMMMQTTTTSIPAEGNLYFGWNPKNVAGIVRDYGQGISGNIVNPDTGKIAGRMRFKALDSVPVTQSTMTVVPFDPITATIAVAILAIESKLEVLQEKMEEILQFMKLEKQSQQRGNLNMLSDFLEGYKLNHANEAWCTSRMSSVLEIQRDAQKDILFYQTRIAEQLQKQRLLHSGKDVQALLSSVMSEFAEYQLACYLYGFSTFLDVMLQKNFDKSFTEGTVQKMKACLTRYNELYALCREQLGTYEQSTIENKLLGAMGTVLKAAGTSLGKVPILNRGPVDEMLTMSGESLDERSKAASAKALEKFESLTDCRIAPFVENIRTVDLMYNQPKGMLMDGENLYILEEEATPA